MGLTGRIRRLFRGFSGLFIRRIEEDNPEALMEAARQDFRDRMVQYKQALARMAAVAERLKSQVQAKTAKATELQRRILANYDAGNTELAGSLARELSDLRGYLAGDIQELQQTEEAYTANLQQARTAQTQFEEKIARLDQQLSQVKVREAQAEAAGALTSVSFNVGDVGDTVKTIEEVLARRLETSAGKTRLARDLAGSQLPSANEAERRALEQRALDEFLRDQGVLPPSQRRSLPDQKDRGESESSAA